MILRKSKIVFVCGWILVAWGSYSNCAKTDHANLSLEKVMVDSIKVATVDVEKGEMKITVFGILPNPAYEFDHFEVEVSGRTIAITPWARYDREKIVIQMMVPLREECVVNHLDHGQYEIKIIGRGKTVSQQIYL